MPVVLYRTDEFEEIQTALTDAVNRTQKASVCHHGQSAVLGIPMYTHATSNQRDFVPKASTDNYSGNGEWSL
jgi:hypothetical protein